MGWEKNTDKKPSGFVLVFLPNERKDEQMQVKKFTDRGWCDCNLDYWAQDNEVSNWMKLPKEPK